MYKTQIKILEDLYSSSLENKVNEFLLTIKTQDINSIQFIAGNNGYWAMINYDIEVAGDSSLMKNKKDVRLLVTNDSKDYGKLSYPENPEYCQTQKSF